MESRQVDISRLACLPVTVTIPMKSAVDLAARSIREGRDPARPVIVADDGRNLYPVDGLDALEAYREAGRTQIRCTVVDTPDGAGAQMLHIGYSRRLPANPFLVLDAMDWIEKSGSPVRDVDPRYARLAELPLSGEVREAFGAWLERLARRLDTMPQFWHIFRPLSELDPQDQSRALDSVMAFVNAMGISPDTSSLRGILRQFARAREDAGQRVSPVPGGPGTPTPDGPGEAAPSPVDHASRVSCDCGQEWYVDAGAKSVRRVKDTDGMTVLTDQCGQPVYPVPREIAEHLSMGESPVYHYLVPGSFPTALVSGRQLDAGIISGVAKALRPAG